MLCVIKSFDDNYIEENYLFMPIWYNSYIRVGMKVLFIKSWYKKGVKVINDFLDDNGIFCHMYVFKKNLICICVQCNTTV